MVISCSASRSITTSSNTVIKKQEPKVVSIKRDTVPANKLLTEEKELKKEIVKTVASSSSIGSEAKILEVLDTHSKMLMDVFNLSVTARLKLDSAERVSKEKDTTIKYKDQYIQYLKQQREEDAKTGKAIKEQIQYFGNVGIKIVIVLFGVLGLIVWGLNTIKKILKQKVKQVKSDNV